MATQRWNTFGLGIIVGAVIVMAHTAYRVGTVIDRVAHGFTWDQSQVMNYLTAVRMWLLPYL